MSGQQSYHMRSPHRKKGRPPLLMSKCAFHEVIEEHAFVLAGCLLACEFRPAPQAGSQVGGSARGP